MKELPLKNSPHPALVDDEDFDRLAAFEWYLQHPKKGPVQVVRACRDQLPLRKVVLHRTQGYPAVVHKDGDPLNCRKANLAEVPRSSVSKTSPREPGQSGRLGVTHYPLRDEWRVVVYHRGGSVVIGYWKDLDQATRAYDHAAVLIKGPEAPTNLSLGNIAPDAVTPEVDAALREEAEKAVRNDQPRYPRSGRPAEPTIY